MGSPPSNNSWANMPKRNWEDPTEAIRIVDRFAFQGFTKNSDQCNFRLLQHNRHRADITCLGAASWREKRDGLSRREQGSEAGVINLGV